MQLEKYYCDIVDDGRAQVHYQATLRLGRTVLGYRGHLSTGGRHESRFLAGEGERPTLHAKRLTWRLPEGIAEFDHAGDAGPVVSLWDDGRYQMTWQPIVPNARVYGPGLGQHARGYVEVLRTNFGPWRLGLKKLVWGRFCGERHSLVWIVWEGSHPRRLALLNGSKVRIASAGLTGVITEAAALEITAPQVLVSERMDQGALKAIPLSGMLSRLDFLRGIETKWHATAVLNLARPSGTASDSGHVIFEEVTWG